MNQGNEQTFEPQDGIGQALRRARNEAGLSVMDVAQRLHMSVHVIEALEAENWDRLGAPVFVRGQLRSYARMLGLPVEQVMQMPQLSPVTVPDLQPRTYTPPMQRFAEQAARRAVYIVLTVAILVPVWLATRPHITDVADNATPLDAPIAGTAESGVRPASPAADTQQGQGHDGVPAQQRPRETMIASIAPIPQRQPTAPVLALKFSGDSWVQIMAPDGAVVESGLLKAGEERSYEAGQVGRMVLGNASAVELQHQGEVQDLAPYLRANVARFTVSSDGSLASSAN